MICPRLRVQFVYNFQGLMVKNAVFSVYYFLSKWAKKEPLTYRKCSKIKGLEVIGVTGFEPVYDSRFYQ